MLSPPVGQLLAICLWIWVAPGCSLLQPTISTMPGVWKGQGDQKENPLDPSDSIDLAICLETAELARNRGMDDEAIEQYLRARKLNPNVRGVSHPLAVLYDRAGMADAAEREYLIAKKEHPEDPDVLCDFGYFLYSRGRLPEAEASLRGALVRSPGHRQSQVNLGLVLGSGGNYAEAEELFREAIGPAAALHNIGMLKLRGGDQTEALAHLKAAAERDPSLRETRGVIAKMSDPSLWR